VLKRCGRVNWAQQQFEQLFEAEREGSSTGVAESAS
jgi:hypothetical protein